MPLAHWVDPDVKRHSKQGGWGTHEAINTPRADPLPIGIARFPLHKTSPVAGVPVGCASALDTASLHLRLSASRYDPSCTSVGVEVGVGVTDGRLRVVRARRLRGPLDEGRLNGGGGSTATVESGREHVAGGAGEEELLEGRRKEGVKACIVQGVLQTSKRCKTGVCASQDTMNPF